MTNGLHDMNWSPTHPCILDISDNLRLNTLPIHRKNVKGYYVQYPGKSSPVYPALSITSPLTRVRQSVIYICRTSSGLPYYLQPKLHLTDTIILKGNTTIIPTKQHSDAQYFMMSGRAYNHTKLDNYTYCQCSDTMLLYST